MDSPTIFIFERISMIEKPLGQKAYGHIAHLPGSKLGVGDHKLEDGMTELLTVKTKNKNQLVIVSEKLDGSNVSVAKVDNVLIPLIRSGYRADTSNYLQHRIFAQWVYKNQDRFQALLKDNERACGEWLMQTHSIPYNLLHEPFAIFDIIQGGHRRMTHSEFRGRLYHTEFMSPVIFHLMNGACSIELAIKELGEKGFHGALEKPEGAVWRIEEKKFEHRKEISNEVLFLGKYVRPDAEAGKHLIRDDSKALWNKYLGNEITPGFVLNEKFETVEAFYQGEEL